jgi:hypothetical protein
MQDITFPIGLGQRFTRKGKPYPTINRPQIEGLVESPHSREKADALWFIPSSYSAGWARTHLVQQELGEFWWLTADIDEGSPSIDNVIGAVEAALGDVHMMVYSSSGATPGNLKWRVLVPLSEPFAPYAWVEVQTAFFDELELEGLNVDEVLKRAGQLVYLPNVPPSRSFYQYRKIKGARHALS